MRCIIFSGVTLAALAISVITPAHARMNVTAPGGRGGPPVVGVPPKPPTCETTSQCYSFTTNGLMAHAPRNAQQAQAKPH